MAWVANLFDKAEADEGEDATHMPAINALLAVTFAIVAVGEVWSIDPQPLNVALKLLATVLVIGTAFTVGFREVRPWLMFVINCALVVAVVVVGHPGDAYAWTNLVMLFTLADTSSLRRSLVGAALSLMAIGSYFWFVENERSAAIAGFAGLIWCIGWLVGRVRRSARVAAELTAVGTAQKIELGRRQELLELETQRTTIVREVHDLVGHTVNVMIVHASAGRRAKDAKAVDKAFETIEVTGRQALEELDQTLRLLRADDDRAVQDERGRRGIDDLVDLVAQLPKTVGFRVDLDLPSSAEIATRPVGADVQFSCYRIVQEALTNVMKHSNATEVVVVVELDGSSLHVRVTDNGTVHHEPWVRGRGLDGMQDRARVHGGSCAVTSHEGGGVDVVAHLPFMPVSRTSGVL